ncbi:Vacuolar protein sorting-associated protein vps5 [Dipsacomyces acuminosporus]|nr:Vacuolar protein sorting-associated protein vps5 [Dipsacomyces acuminosporus]
MEGDELFGSGFGTAASQSFTFGSEEMNPFGDTSSPWNDEPSTSQASANAPAAHSNDDAEEQEEDDDNDMAQLEQATKQQLSITSQTSNEEHAKTSLESISEDQEASSPLSDSQGSEASTDATKEEPAVSTSDAPSTGKPLAKTAAAAPVSPYGTQAQTARRVGVIKRGLRSPRVLGTQLSSGPLDDPLSSAVKNGDTDNDSVSAAAAAAAAAAVSPARASVDSAGIRNAHRNIGLHHAPARQTRSFSETGPFSNDGGTSGALNKASKASDARLASSHPPPHPYDQQLSPTLQQEQATHSRQPAESIPPAERSSTGSASGRLSTTSRVYLGVHQRRKSLDPTPVDQIPKFSIQVMDPVKVSDSLKSYIAYKVKTQSDAPMFRESEMVVRRRYRDFDWLIQELVARHPGIIVPAIPEKQSMGRFEDEFVESRRAGLESCLTRISEHPVLWSDDVFRLFLEADDFASKARVITENRIAAEINGTSSSLGSGSGSGSGGLFGDGWGGAKYKEKDEWFAKRMQELDTVEEELRALLRALEYSQRQRRELSIAHGELGEAYLKMAGQELNKSLSNGLTDMGSLQQKLKVLQSRQGVADFAAFQLTTDEYIRIISSVRTAFSARGRAYGRWQSSLSDLIKKRKVLEGYVQHPSRASPERMAQLKGEIARAEIRTEGNRNAFDDVSQILKQEMARFDANRVRDFQAAVESYLMSLIDTQEEIVMLWEAYLTSLRNSEHGPNEGGSVA